MYSFNYIDNLIIKEKYSDVLVRFLKVLNLIFHIIIITIVVFAILQRVEIQKTNEKIGQTKISIENKRDSNRIIDIEKEWEICYYRLVAINEILKNKTNYGFIFKDFGTFIPGNNSILNISIKENDGNASFLIKDDALEKLNSFFDYSSTLSSNFEKSTYIDNNIMIENLDKIKIGKKEIKSLKLKLKVNSRK